jgi:hypothetical protein
VAGKRRIAGKNASPACTVNTQIVRKTVCYIEVFLPASQFSGIQQKLFIEERMKNRILGFKALLLLGGVLSLCSASFIVGRRSVETNKPVAHVTHEMNELDRLQLETAKQR